jgi:hypothetical protein
MSRDTLYRILRNEGWPLDMMPESAETYFFPAGDSGGNGSKEYHEIDDQGGIPSDLMGCRLIALNDCQVIESLSENKSLTSPPQPLRIRMESLILRE